MTLFDVLCSLLINKLLYKKYVLLQSKATLSAMPWDITVLRIINKVDGQISVHRIAEEADVCLLLC